MANCIIAFSADCQVLLRVRIVLNDSVCRMYRRGGGVRDPSAKTVNFPFADSDIKQFCFLAATAVASGRKLLNLCGKEPYMQAYVEKI